MAEGIGRFMGLVPKVVWGEIASASEGGESAFKSIIFGWK